MKKFFTLLLAVISTMTAFAQTDLPLNCKQR